MNDDERIEQLKLENKVLQENNKGLKAKIDELQKENEELSEKMVDKICKGVEEELLEEYRGKIKKLQKELDIKDKVIDLMVEVIEDCRQNGCIEFNEEIDLSDIAGEEMVKKYFYKKVEEENAKN